MINEPSRGAAMRTVLSMCAIVASMGFSSAAFAADFGALMPAEFANVRDKVVVQSVPCRMAPRANYAVLFSRGDVSVLKVARVSGDVATGVATFAPTGFAGAEPRLSAVDLDDDGTDELRIDMVDPKGGGVTWFAAFRNGALENVGPNVTDGDQRSAIAGDAVLVRSLRTWILISSSVVNGGAEGDYYKDVFKWASGSFRYQNTVRTAWMPASTSIGEAREYAERLRLPDEGIPYVIRLLCVNGDACDAVAFVNGGAATNRDEMRQSGTSASAPLSIASGAEVVLKFMARSAPVLVLVEPPPLASNRRPVIPVVECVRTDGPRPFEARFGYDNPNAGDVVIRRGESNSVYPSLAAEWRQPVVFLPGRHRDMLRQTSICEGAGVTTAAPTPSLFEVRWSLDGTTASAAADFPVSCADENPENLQ